MSDLTEKRRLSQEDVDFATKLSQGGNFVYSQELRERPPRVDGRVDGYVRASGKHANTKLEGGELCALVGSKLISVDKEFSSVYYRGDRIWWLSDGIAAYALPLEEELEFTLTGRLDKNSPSMKAWRDAQK